MEFLSWINILLAILILDGLAIALLLKYVQMLAEQCRMNWRELLAAIRKRNDLIPLLHWRTPQSMLNDEWQVLLKLRAQSMPLSECNGKKVEAEWELSASLKELLSKIEEITPINQIYLINEVKQDILEQGQKVEQLTEKYNQTVRKLNALLRNPLLKIFLKYSKIKSQHVFEFEG